MQFYFTLALIVFSSLALAEKGQFAADPEACRESMQAYIPLQENDGLNPNKKQILERCNQGAGSKFFHYCVTARLEEGNPIDAAENFCAYLKRK